MHTKLIVVLALVCTVVCRDVSIGRSLGGRKIFDEIRQANPAIWRQIENVTIIGPDDEVISGVVVTDRRPEKDGDADIVDGGDGQNSVTIELKSPTVLRGYEFQIEVYTVPSTKYTDAEENLPTPVEGNKDLPENNESTTLSEKNGSGDSDVSENQGPVTTEEPENPEKDSPTFIGKESNDNNRQARKTEEDEVSKSTEADDMLEGVPPIVTNEPPTTEIPENDNITTEAEQKTTVQQEVTSAPVMFDNSKNIPDFPALDILDMIKAKESSRNTRNTAVKEATTQTPTEAPTESEEPKTTELNDSYQNSDSATDAPSNSNNDDVIDLMPPELSAPFNTDFSDDSKPDPSNTRAGRGLSVIDIANDVPTENASEEKSENTTTEAANEEKSENTTTEAANEEKSENSTTVAANEEKSENTSEAPANEQLRNVRHTDEDGNSVAPVEPQNEMPSCNSDLGNRKGMTNVILVNEESLTSDGPKLRFELPIVFILGEGKLPTIKIILENPEEKPDLAVPIPVAVPESPETVPEDPAAVPELPLDDNTPTDYDLPKPMVITDN